MEFWDRLDSTCEQLSVLRHPFYRRWSEGKLGREELAYYSGQYRHAVIALADAAASAAMAPEAGDDRPILAAHAAEEAAHVALWEEFVAEVGGDCGAAARPETSCCVAAWAGDGTRSLLRALAAMYAIESAQPAISQAKLDGLAAHYGIPSSAYFELHRELDEEHAAEARALIERRMTSADAPALIATAESVLGANWRLLDGVEKAALEVA